MVTFIAWIVFILLEQKSNLNFMNKYIKKYFCGIVKPSEKDGILECYQYMKSDEMPYIIYAKN